MERRAIAEQVEVDRIAQRLNTLGQIYSTPRSIDATASLEEQRNLRIKDHAERVILGSLVADEMCAQALAASTGMTASVRIERFNKFYQDLAQQAEELEMMLL